VPVEDPQRPAHQNTAAERQAEEAPQLSQPVDPAREGLPDWLRELWRRGEEFNQQNRWRYLYNEVEVEVKGVKYRVDSYTPGEAIVSRRLTQLASIQESTAIGYFQEFTRKYPPGALITDSPFNKKAIRGTTLAGDLIFEVPVQEAAVPQRVRDAASARGITIRDVEGRVYNP
jgi:hypothetical protein